ncbi:MAG: hypothetical protein FWD04_01560, partial [Conexibacteraceae bacterium]|nr:hypothetical protein [Conexibacteraceae bacterium]
MHAAGHPVPVASVRSAIAKLYRDHPGVATYSVQAVSYDSRSRDRVLQACSTGGAQVTAQVESERVLACAPLIFFYYHYGQSAGVRQSTEVADSIYSYVATEIHGPADAQSILDGVLHGWGIPVAAQPAQASHTTPGAMTLVDAVNRAMGARHSVRVTIAGYAGGTKPFERITSDASNSQGIELIHA